MRQSEAFEMIFFVGEVNVTRTRFNGGETTLNVANMNFMSLIRYVLFVPCARRPLETG